MAPPHTGARPGRPPAGVRLVRELPLAVEPGTRDPYNEAGRTPVAGSNYSPQPALVRESLVRCPRGEELS